MTDLATRTPSQDVYKRQPAGSTTSILAAKYHGDEPSAAKCVVLKMCIRDRLNMTQIADRLGYSSLYYFSRQFKKTAAMSPSEYAASIRILSEKRPRGEK